MKSSKRSRPGQPTKKGQPHMSNRLPFTPAPVKNEAYKRDTSATHGALKEEEKGTGRC